MAGDANAYHHLGPRFVHTLEANVDVAVAFTKDEACDDHYIVVSTSPDPGGFTWGVSPNQPTRAPSGAPTTVPCDLSMCYIGASCGYCLEAVDAADCPADLGPDFVHCEDPSLGDDDLCEGDGECGTSTTLDNCGEGFEVYRKRCLATVPELAYATGSDGNGRLGDGVDHSSTSTPVRIMSAVALVDVAAGYAHSLFVAADGQAYGAGYDHSYCFGADSSWDYHYIPVP
eukprot:gene10399-12298_t